MTKSQYTSILFVLLVPCSLFAQTFKSPELDLDNVLSMAEGDVPDEMWQKRAEKEDYAVLWPEMGNACRVEGSLNFYQFRSADFRLQAKHISSDSLANFFILFSDNPTLLEALIGQVERRSVSEEVFSVCASGLVFEDADSLENVVSSWGFVEDTLAKVFTFYELEEFRIAILERREGTYIYIVDQILFNGYLSRQATLTRKDLSDLDINGQMPNALVIPVQVIDERFENNESTLMSYVARNVDAKIAECLDPRVKYVVIISVTVEVDGEVSRVFIEESSGIPSLDEGVLKVFRSPPALFPAQINGEPFKQTLSIPARFQVF